MQQRSAWSVTVAATLTVDRCCEQIMVYETNPSSGYSSFGDYITECPGDLKAIFDKFASPTHPGELSVNRFLDGLTEAWTLSAGRCCCERRYFEFTHLILTERE